MIRKLLCWLGWHEWRLCWCREEKDRFVGYIICNHCQKGRDWFFTKHCGKVKK